MPVDLLTDLRALLARYDRHHAYNDCDGVSPADLAAALARAVEALEEREADMHLRIRKGYDKTVADAWRAHCATVEQALDDARRALVESRGEVERLRRVLGDIDSRTEAVVCPACMDIRAMAEAALSPDSGRDGGGS